MKIRYFNIDGAYCDWIRNQIVLDEDLKHFSILHDFVRQHEIFHFMNKNKFWRNLKFDAKSHILALLNPAIYDEITRYNDFKAMWNRRNWKQIFIGKIYSFIEDIIISLIHIFSVPIAMHKLKKYEKNIYYGFRWLDESSNLCKSIN